MTTDPYGGVTRSLRVRHRLTLVRTGVRHPLPDQDRCFQGQTTQGNKQRFCFATT